MHYWDLSRSRHNIAERVTLVLSKSYHQKSAGDQIECFGDSVLWNSLWPAKSGKKNLSNEMYQTKCVCVYVYVCVTQFGMRMFKKGGRWRGENVGPRVFVYSI